MKSATLIIFLLIASIFAGIFVFAESVNTTISSADEGAAVITESDIDSLTGIEPENIKESLKEAETAKGFKKVGFAKIWRGHGWISNNDEGHLISGFWISQKFAKIDVANKKIEKKTVRTYGRLRIAGEGIYRLVRAPTNEEIENTSSVSFYVIPLNRKIYAKEDELMKDAVGKLVLNRKDKFKGLTIWNGNLDFDGRKLHGSWKVELGTDLHIIRHSQVKRIRAVIGKLKKARVKINETLAISPAESSESGEISAEETLTEPEKEIYIRPVKIKRRRFLFIIPTGKKYLEIEVKKGNRIYRERIEANKEKKIEGHTIGVGDLTNPSNIELNIK